MLVSPTSLVEKLLEVIPSDRIYQYFQRQELLKNSLHGFVCGKSCLTNLITLFEEVTKRIDKGRALNIAYIDFNKVFHKIVVVGQSGGISWLNGYQIVLVIGADVW